MYKVKLKRVILTLAFFVTVLIISINVFATTENNQVTDLRIKITDGTKDLTDNIQEIEFKVNENKNVVNGKFAPGCTAESNLYLDLVDIDYPVEFTLSVDKNELFDNINIYTKIDGIEYQSGNELIIVPENGKFSEEDGIIPIELKLVWEDGIQDMEEIKDVLSIPISFSLAEHI